MNSISYFLIALLILLVLYWVWRRRKDARHQSFTPNKTIAPPPRPFGEPTDGIIAVRKVDKPIANNSVTSTDPLQSIQDLIDQQRYEDAIRELKTGLIRQPTNNRFMLKLLNVYALTNNLRQFNKLFERVQLQGNADTVEQANNLKQLLEEEAVLNGSIDNNRTITADDSDYSESLVDDLESDKSLIDDFNAKSDDDLVNNLDNEFDNSLNDTLDSDFDSNLDPIPRSSLKQQPTSSTSDEFDSKSIDQSLNYDENITFEDLESQFLNTDNTDFTKSDKKAVTKPIVEDTSTPSHLHSTEHNLIEQDLEPSLDSDLEYQLEEEQDLDESIYKQSSTKTQDDSNEINTFDFSEELGLDDDDIVSNDNATSSHITDDSFTQDNSLDDKSLGNKNLGDLNLSNTNLDDSNLDHLNVDDKQLNTDLSIKSKEKRLSEHELNLEDDLETKLEDDLSDSTKNIDESKLSLSATKSQETQESAKLDKSATTDDINHETNDNTNNELDAKKLETQAIESNTQNDLAKSYDDDKFNFESEDESDSPVLQTSSNSDLDDKIEEVESVAPDSIDADISSTPVSADETFQTDSSDSESLPLDSKVSKDTLNVEDKATESNDIDDASAEVALKDEDNKQAATDNLGLQDSLSLQDPLVSQDSSDTNEMVSENEETKLTALDKQSTTKLTDTESQPEVVEPSTAPVEESVEDGFLASHEFIHDLDNTQITLELAEQYLKLGEYDSAKRLVNEVMRDNATEAQRRSAQELLSRID